MGRHRDKYADKVPGGRNRSCRKRDGSPKRKYDRPEAERVVLCAAAEGKPPMRAYECPVCGSWHVGTIRTEGS